LCSIATDLRVTQTVNQHKGAHRVLAISHWRTRAIGLSQCSTGCELDLVSAMVLNELTSRDLVWGVQALADRGRQKSATGLADRNS
jgi:hypothetical protein